MSSRIPLDEGDIEVYWVEGWGWLWEVPLYAFRLTPEEAAHMGLQPPSPLEEPS